MSKLFLCAPVMLIMRKLDISRAAKTFLIFLRSRGLARERASSVAAQGSTVQGLEKWAVCEYFKLRKCEFFSKKF